MSIGAVLVAQNNSTIDYVKLAIFSAQRIKDFLDIPVSILTDSRGYVESQYPNHPFDQIIDIPFGENFSQRRFNDGSLTSKILEWKNLSRYRTYDLSPYDTTLVVDVDYIINSSVLKSALYLDCPLQIYSNSMDIAEWRDLTEFQRINPYSIPFYWATVFIFNKGAITESFFMLLTHIKDNWDYYRTLYCVTSPMFRNDIAFSIAIHIMDGKTSGDFAQELPGKMIYGKDTDVLISIENTTMKFLIEKKNYLGEYTLAKTHGLDVHVMNKLSLSRYIDGGTGV
jgi:hypothetical protein